MRLIHPTDLSGSAPPSCLSAPIPRKYRALAHTAMPVRKNTMVMGGICDPPEGWLVAPPRIVNETSRKGNDGRCLRCRASAARHVLGLGLPGADPRHHGPQLGPHGLDRMLGRLPPQSVEHRPVGLVLQDPLLGEGAGLDLVEDLLHLGPGVGGD